MRAHFPLFTTPLDLAHSFWENLLQPQDCVIDATCGRGKDSLTLCRFLDKKGGGTLYCLDVQPDAIESSKKRLAEEASCRLSKVHFFLQSHIAFPEEVLLNPIRLIVYNLGYLPGSDKSITTDFATTLQSLANAQNLLTPGGVISITCYPGHPAGAIEKTALMQWASLLDPCQWSVTYTDWLNRHQSPGLLLIQKKS